MAKMDSNQASSVKKAGENAKFKLAKKLNSISSRKMYLDKSTHSEIVDKIKTDGKLMLRVGKNWQFNLGDMPEIGSIDYFSKSLVSKKINNKIVLCGQYDISWEKQLKYLKSMNFWNKYLVKGHEVYCFSNDNFEYFFFNIHEMINFIMSNIEWRLLETGRIKGDLRLESKQKVTIFTIEYRNEIHKKCFAFGAHGGNKGVQLFLILLRNIKHYHCQL